MSTLCPIGHSNEKTRSLARVAGSRRDRRRYCVGRVDGDWLVPNRRRSRWHGHEPKHPVASFGEVGGHGPPPAPDRSRLVHRDRGLHPVVRTTVLSPSGQRPPSSSWTTSCRGGRSRSRRSRPTTERSSDTTSTGTSSARTLAISTSRPATPRLNGKVERSHRIDAEEFCRLIDGVVEHDTGLFNMKLKEWEDCYNYHRPHGRPR